MRQTGAMELDQRTFNLAAAVISAVAAAVSLGSALFGRNKGNGAVLPALLGLAGATAWVVSAKQELDRSHAEPS